MQLLRVWFLIGLCTMPLSRVQADNKPGEKTAPQELAQEQANDDRPNELASQQATPTDERDVKQKKALAGFMMLALICVVFLFFILAIAVVSSRFRKEVSRPLSKSQQTDPLWYLKNPPNDEPPSSSLIAEQPE